MSETVIFGQVFEPYQVLPLRVKVDLLGIPHLPHYWSLRIILFSVISVYSATFANWVNENFNNTI